MAQSKLKNICKFLREFNLDLPDDVSNDAICIICNKIMVNACQAPCGCRYCWDCLSNYLNGDERKCPGQSNFCNDELINLNENVNIDHYINNKISRLIVKCPEKCCDFKCELNKLEDHIRICDNQPIKCSYFNIGCSEDKVVHDQIKDHLLLNIYPHSQLLIEYLDKSKKDFQLLKNDVLDLKDELKNVKLDGEIKHMAILELQTNEKVNIDKINQLKEEIKTLTNENKSIQKIINNQIKQIADLNQDMVALRNVDRNMQQSIDNVCIQLETNITQEREMAGEIVEINKNIFASIIDNANIKKQFINTNIQIDKQNEQINILQQSLQQSTNKLEEIKLSNEEKQTELMIKTNEISNKNIDLTNRSNDTLLTMKMIEYSTNNMDNKLIKIERLQQQQNWGEFVWVIDQWNEKCTQAQNNIDINIYSFPFYTHKNGYKLCLQLCPNGYGNDKGTHLSLFHCVMKGDFDDILQWPFLHDVTIAIINQDNGLMQCSHTLLKTDQPNHNGRMKPKNERNNGLGQSKFISLTELSNNKSVVKNNQVFIKCSVKIFE